MLLSRKTSYLILPCTTKDFPPLSCPTRPTPSANQIIPIWWSCVSYLIFVCMHDFRSAAQSGYTTRQSRPISRLLSKSYLILPCTHKPQVFMTLPLTPPVEGLCNQTASWLVVVDELSCIQLATFNTGSLAQTKTGQWNRYCLFSCPSAKSTSVLCMGRWTGSGAACADHEAQGVVAKRDQAALGRFKLR